MSQGLRWDQAEPEMFESLKRTSTGAFQVTLKNEDYLLEAFDQPLVVQNVEIKDRLELQFPYGFKATADFKSLSCDSFDRFHGLTDQGFPFVFSRKAQAQLFNLAEDYDDDSLTFNGHKYQLEPWLVEDQTVIKNDFWDKRYSSGETQWNMSEPHPGLVDALPQLKLPRSRIGILGCGEGHDAAFLAKSGHLVTAYDFSDEALKKARELYGTIPGLTFKKADVFEMKERECFDVIFEHTFFCAIPPSKREELIALWRQLLTPSGYVLGIFFVVEKRKGPPWGATEWELKRRMQKKFEALYWNRLRVGPRLGRELIMLMRKI